MKMTIVCATGNPGKLREIREIMGSRGYNILSAGDLGVSVQPEETGATFEENAVIKARAMAAAAHLPSLGDDSGLEVDALGGAPGVLSARYGGLSSDEERNEYLLGNLSGVPASKRGARFVCCLCCAFPDGRIITARGTCGGVILSEPRGKNGFGYDPLFLLPELGKTMAELDAREKNSVSHRARAIRSFLEEMEKMFNGTDK